MSPTLAEFGRAGSNLDMSLPDTEAHPSSPTPVVSAHLILTATVSLLTAGLGLSQTPTLTSLGSGAQPTDVSADGSIVVGASFRWTASSGIVGIGGAGGHTSISRDGTTIAASAIDVVSGDITAATWQGGTSWLNLGGLPGQAPCGNDLSSGYGLSADGSVVVGLGWITGCRAHGFRWEQATGMVDLGSTVSGQSSRANGIAAADTSVIIGWQDTAMARQGARWDSGVQSLFTFSGSPVGEATAVTPDASVVVGLAAGGNQAWRWTAATGVQTLGVLPGFNFTGMAFDVTNGGEVIVGTCGFGFDRDAFIWTQTMGMVKLDDYLTGLGLDLSGWDLGSATAISADGKVIAGWGQGPLSFIEGWVITLPGSIGTRYCSPAVTNSSGAPARIEALGSEVSADNSVTLSADQMPTGQFGYFLNGPTQGLISAPGGSVGNLCLGGTIGRHTASVFNTGSSGSTTLQLDLTDLPFPGGGHTISPGETWNWTAWFRDGGTSNFTDGISILFL